MVYSKEDSKSKGIYKITNIINGKFYIGSASSVGGFKRRWDSHKIGLINGKHRNKYLQSAWGKYGKESFIFEIIEIIRDDKIILIREQYYLDTLTSWDTNIGYNICKIAGNTLGTKRSKLVKEKMSLSRLKLKPSIDTRQKMSISRVGNKNNLGKKHSEETKRKISESNKGKGKLTTEQSLIIIKKHKDGEKRKILSKEYNVSLSTIDRAINKK